jgi:hypothetical protein
MSVAAEILEELSRRGVTVLADGETIRLKPRAPVDDGLLARVKAHKPEILAVLSSRPACCSSTCYEIEPGRWIHHPWHGCTTPMPPAEVQLTAERPCSHCNGAGACDCITCGRFETHAVWKPGPCVPCRVKGRERVQ